MALLFAPPVWQPLTGSAVTLPGALLYFYKTGTTTAQTVYTDSALSTAHAQPVVADADGYFAAIYLDETLAFDYKIVLQDKDANVLQTVDPVLAQPAFYSSDAGAAGAPDLLLDRDSASPAVDDVLGRIIYRGENDAAQDVDYGQIQTEIADETDGTEDGRIALHTMDAGTLRAVLTLAAGLATLASADAGATANPILKLHRDSASPADNDVIGQVDFDGEDSAGNQETYVRLLTQILDVTATTEDAELEIHTVLAGTLAARLVIAAGLYTGGATGGDQGVDTINASSYYVDGVRATVFAGYVDAAATGEIMNTSGWSASTSATGKYLITHNLGLSTPISDLSITATSVGSLVLNVTNAGANSFEIWSQTGVGTLTDGAFYFQAVRNV